MDNVLLDAAKLHAEAVKIISMALEECSHPTLTPRDHEGNATALLARLAHANILLERYDENESVENISDKYAIMLIRELSPQNDDASYREAVKEIVEQCD
jgi:hypothetical protein